MGGEDHRQRVAHPYSSEVGSTSMLDGIDVVDPQPGLLRGRECAELQACELRSPSASTQTKRSPTIRAERSRQSLL